MVCNKKGRRDTWRGDWEELAGLKLDPPATLFTYADTTPGETMGSTFPLNNGAPVPVLVFFSFSFLFFSFEMSGERHTRAEHFDERVADACTIKISMTWDDEERGESGTYTCGHRTTLRR